MKIFKVLGIRVWGLDEDEIIGFVVKKIKSGQSAQITTVNNEFIVEAQRNKRFKEALNNSDLSIVDSTGLKWAIKYLYKEKIGRIPGVDLVLKLCEISSKRGYRIFLFGGAKGVGAMAKRNLAKSYPALRIVGIIDGINVDANKSDAEILKRINGANADIVFVALGAPKQDLWIANNISKLKPGIFIGVGGSLDYISGQISRAPKFLREIGLEWFYRLIVQPSRFGRIIKATVVFPIMVIFSKRRAA